MPKAHKAYPEEFKKKLVALVREGRSAEELSRQFEPSAQSIRNWVAQVDRDAGTREDGLATHEREELQRLRRENERLREEREILKKAAAWFAQESKAAPNGSSHS
jgi:transposase